MDKLNKEIEIEYRRWRVMFEQHCLASHNELLSLKYAHESWRIPIWDTGMIPLQPRRGRWQ